MRNVKRITALEVAEYFGIHKMTVGRWIRAKGIDMKDPRAVIEFILWIGERLGVRGDKDG